MIRPRCTVDNMYIYMRVYLYICIYTYTREYIQCIIHGTMCRISRYILICILAARRKLFDRGNAVEAIAFVVDSIRGHWETTGLSAASLSLRIEEKKKERKKKQSLISSLSECLCLNYSEAETRMHRKMIIGNDRIGAGWKRAAETFEHVATLPRRLYIVPVRYEILTKPHNAPTKTISFRG